MKRIQLLLMVTFIAVAVTGGWAQVRLPSVISDGMVLQRNSKVTVWGWASPGERITVTFAKRRQKATANAQGEWSLELPAMKAGGPYQMTIQGRNEIHVDDILVGDVWLCAGQSNMVHQMDIHDVTYASDIAEAKYAAIRHFKIPTQTSLAGPEANVSGASWERAIGDEVRPFSAVAYFFARKLYEKYQVPIGLVNASVGGTPIEAWISEEGLDAFPDLQKAIKDNKRIVQDYGTAHGEGNPEGAPVQMKDKGLTGDKPWYAVDFRPKNWRRINIPGYWEDQGIKELDGVVWYRREVDIPELMAKKSAHLFMGRVVDADKVYINGKEVGSTTYQYPQRRYSVPTGVLKAGKNVFVIRVTNFNGKGGFVPDKPYYIFSGKDTVDLKGYWEYKVGEVFSPRERTTRRIVAQNQPAALYNGMVAPFIHFPVKGMLWYQGESNAGRPEAYAALLPALISDWREKFDNPDAPFIYAQLPNFMEVNYLPSESNWALLRESQLKSLEIANTAMTVNIDLGEWNDIHPDNKKDVGERMALAAMNIAYGEDVVYSGPIYESHKIEGSKVVIHFSHVGSGLTTSDGAAPSEFAIAGEDKKFVWARARIEGDKVVVWHEDVSYPQYVRYAWADNPDNPNLYNREGLPASPFRIGED